MTAVDLTRNKKRAIERLPWDQIMVGLKCQVSTFRLDMGASGEPRRILRRKPGDLWTPGSSLRLPKVGAEAQAPVRNYRDRFALLRIQTQEHVAQGPHGLPRSQGLGGGGDAVYMYGGHTSSHTQHQLVPAQVKELGHWEDAGDKVAILALGPELQALLLAVDFQGNLHGIGREDIGTEIQIEGQVKGPHGHRTEEKTPWARWAGVALGTGME